ncbi:MAG TPA: MoaD/ThiS family protein, partial [Nitrospiraceae bacterium]|nr:MoaD/ThiS family protein [Nitrospiraceae bacterium]
GRARWPKARRSSGSAIAAEALMSTAGELQSICFHPSPSRIIAPVRVQLSHPARTIEVKGPKKVKELLRELNLVVEAHLVIKGDDLVTEDEMLYEGDQIEIRPVISGG